VFRWTRWTRIFTVALVASAALGIQACAQKLSPQANCNFVVNGQQQRVSWSGRLPVVLYIDRTVPTEFYNSIQSAVSDWNRQLGKEVLRIGGVTSQSTMPGRDGANIIYWSNYWERDRTYEQARTTMIWAGDQIQEADIRVNALDFKYSTGNLSYGGYVDFESLMVHELGHVIGLAHVDQGESVMVKSLPSDYLRRQPSDFDIRSAQCEY
jgi:hypothetical protein